MSKGFENEIPGFLDRTVRDNLGRQGTEVPSTDRIRAVGTWVLYDKTHDDEPFGLLAAVGGGLIGVGVAMASMLRMALKQAGFVTPGVETVLHGLQGELVQVLKDPTVLEKPRGTLEERREVARTHAKMMGRRDEEYSMSEPFTDWSQESLRAQWEKSIADAGAELMEGYLLVILRRANRDGVPGFTIALDGAIPAESWDPVVASVAEMALDEQLAVARETVRMEGGDAEPELPRE